MSDADITTTCADLEREYPERTFWVRIQRDLGVVEYRVSTGIHGVRETRSSGWCPTVKGAADEIRYILGEAVRK